MKTLGQRLIYLMERKDMKQTELSESIHISKQSLYKYTHDFCEPRSEIIARMAKALNTSADYIVGLTENPEPIYRTAEDEQRVKAETAFLSQIRSLTFENRIRLEERLKALLESQKN